MLVKKKLWMHQSPFVKASGGGSPPTGITRVQGKVFQNGSNSSPTVVGLLDAPVTPGNLVCVAFGATQTIALLQDDLGTNAVASASTGLINGFIWSAFYFPNVAGTPQTYTGTVGGSEGFQTFSTLIVTEFAGLSATPFDVAAVNLGQAGTNATDGVTSTPMVTTANGDLIWSACVNTTGNSTLVKSSAFNQSDFSGGDFNTEYVVQSVAGSIAGTFTGTTADTFSTLAMAFKHA